MGKRSNSDNLVPLCSELWASPALTMDKDTDKEHNDGCAVIRYERKTASGNPIKYKEASRNQKVQQ